MAARRVRGTMTWLFGPLVWAAHFFLLYGIASFGCAPSEATRQESIRLVSWALSAAALVALAGFLASQLFVRRNKQLGSRTDTPGFLGPAASVLAILASIGVIWTALGAVMIPACVAAMSHLFLLSSNFSRGWWL